MLDLEPIKVKLKNPTPFQVACIIDEDAPALVAEVERLQIALKEVKESLITIRGKDRLHDGEITGVCIGICKVLEGDDYA